MLIWGWRRRATVMLIALSCVTAAYPASAQVSGVFTYHNDNARTGQNLSETILTPKNVSAATFGKLFSRRVDGYVYAQPLYANGVMIPGFSTPQKVVYVTTEHNSVYALDATGARRAPFWHVTFLDRRHHVKTVGWRYVGSDLIVPEIGITGTPVIDPSTRTLYVVAATRERTIFVQRLHALDLSTGREKFGGPVIISGSVPGTGTDSNSGIIHFDPKIQNQRPGLLLQDGVVYMAWASHEDQGLYHGWVMAYDATTLAQLGVWNDSPNGSKGGIWMSGAGIAADAANLFLATGNGTFDANAGGTDYGDSFVKLAPGKELSALDFCTPSDEAIREKLDYDLGSGGVLILPDQSVGPPHLMVQGSEGRVIYVVNRDVMGGITSDNSQMQVIPNAISDEVGTPAYFNSTLYFGGVNDHLKAFQLNNGVLSSSPISMSKVIFGYPGTTPSVSANGSTNGIVWTIQDTAFQPHQLRPAILRAFDASNLNNELYNSMESRRRDLLNGGIKFTVPTVADGHVFVATVKRLTVFGVLPAPTKSIP